MIVTSDTSPIINLYRIGRLDLLWKIFGEIHVPRIKVHSVQNRALVDSLQTELDQREAEAIALSIETSSDLLLPDKKNVRNIAKRLTVKVT